MFEVSGIIDPIVASEIELAIDRAEQNGAQALVLQLNSRSAVVWRDRMADLAERISSAEIPVAIWVGPSGARAYGLPGQLLGVAAASGMARARGSGTSVCHSRSTAPRSRSATRPTVSDARRSALTMRERSAC